MPDAFEEQVVLVAAERAAAEGDTMAAEGHLRELLNLQTARLGTQHPDVASTLHNLAVVCERGGRFDEAEGLYRQAYTVAAATLPPTDALVVRCREDLHAFLDSRGIAAPAPPPLSPPTTAPSARPASAVRIAAAAPRAGTTPTAAPARPRTASGVRPPPPRPTPPPASGAMRWVAPIVAAVVLGGIAAAWTMRGGDGGDGADAAATAGADAAPAPAPAARKRAPVLPRETTPAPPAAGDPSAPASARSSSVPAAAAPPATTTTADGAPSPAGGAAILTASLCRDLTTSGAWQCTPAEAQSPPGRFYFFTRIGAPQTATFTHRWYFGDALVQSVSLRVQPNPSGYRTYSRQTVEARRAGAWRVELVAPDGAVLAEERFTVQ